MQDTLTPKQTTDLALVEVFGSEDPDSLMTLRLDPAWVTYLNKLQVARGSRDYRTFVLAGAFSNTNTTYKLEELDLLDKMLNMAHEHNDRLFEPQPQRVWYSTSPVPHVEQWQMFLNKLSIDSDHIEHLLGQSDTHVMVLTDGVEGRFLGNINAMLVCQRQTEGQYRLFYRDIWGPFGDRGHFRKIFNGWLSDDVFGLSPSCLRLGAMFYCITYRLLNEIEQELQLLVPDRLQYILNEFFESHCINVPATLQPQIRSDSLTTKLALRRDY